MTPCIAILATGQMGASFGPLLASAGVRLVTNLTGRSPRTCALALEGGFEDLKTDSAILSHADVILSVVVPSHALALAERLAAAASSASPIRTRFFADLNAISPTTASSISSNLTTALPHLRVVDGGIIGGPASRSSSPLIVLSGSGAQELHELLGPWLLSRTKVVGDTVGQASAMKLAYASLSKGANALALNAAMMASRYGVGEALEEELGQSQPAMLKVMQGVPKSTAKVRLLRLGG